MRNVEITERNRITMLLVQVLLWLLFGMLLLFYLPLTWRTTLPYQFWIKQLVTFILLVGAYYLNSLIIVPRVLLKNNYFVFILLVLLTAAIVTVTVQLVENGLGLPELMERTFGRNRGGRPGLRPRMHRPIVDMFTMMMSLLVLGISTSVTSIQKWQRDARIRQMLEQEKISSELSFLKAQINPHFFFNTLNNIYALTHVDVVASREALHKLSGMMRYLLYETQSSMTLLSKEIAFVVNYIELMKLRLTDKVTVTFEPPLLKEDPSVAPMLFLPYLENAFKHGVSALRPGYISISFTLEETLLTMEIRNTVYEEKRVVLEESSGIGLNNTRRRLDLLYPGKYTLLVKEDENAHEFRVLLTLDLS